MKTNLDDFVVRWNREAVIAYLCENPEADEALPAIKRHVDRCMDGAEVVLRLMNDIGENDKKTMILVAGIHANIHPMQVINQIQLYDAGWWMDRGLRQSKGKVLVTIEWSKI